MILDIKLFDYWWSQSNYTYILYYICLTLWDNGMDNTKGQGLPLTFQTLTQV